jgi:hypothetical protein
MPPLPPSSPKRRARLEWQIGLFLVNLPMVALLLWAGWQWFRPPAPQPAPAVASPAKSVPAEPIVLDYSGKSPAELERLLQENEKKLGKTSPEAINQAAKLIGLEPAAKPAKADGPFDFARATVQTFEKLPAPNGKYGYRITFIDDAGNTCPVDIPADEVTAADDTAFSLYERAKGDPTFKMLFDLAVKKIMAKEK